MYRVKTCALYLGLSLIFSLSVLAEGQQSVVTPRDCVTVRYIAGMWASRSGTQLAYLVKAPNIEQNRNDYQLYVKDVADRSLSSGRVLLAGIEVSDLSWLDNDQQIALLEEIKGIKQLVIVDLGSGVATSAFHSDRDIASYTMDASGNTVVYTTLDTGSFEQAAKGRTEKEISSGYLVGATARPTDGYPTKSVYIRHRNRSGRWSIPQQITVENPFTHRTTSHLEYARHLSLSPDGKRLFLTYITDGVPEQWMENPDVRLTASMNPLLEIMVLYDLQSGVTKLAFKNIISYSEPVWSEDSKSFFLVTHSPIGSRWESDDIRDHQISPKDVNLFQVDSDSGSVTEVLRRVPPLFDDEGPLAVRADGEVITRLSSTTVGRFKRVGDDWEEVSRIALPNDKADRFQFVASNEMGIVGVHETITTPEDLFILEQGQKSIRLLTDLNPQLKRVSLAPVRDIQWVTKGGLKVDGLLFMPHDYEPSKRYPLVIQTKGDSGWFTCDSGPNHYPSFAPQPIASAGIMYLARKFNDDWNYQEDVDKRPAGYPGGVNEAVQQMDIWDSALDDLDKQGLIDTSKIGTIGFSRTGWYVEFMLTNSRTRFAAATAADNVQYSLGEYWLYPFSSRDEERVYGGPPQGETLKSWQTYSVSFNLAKIHTPLLMEEMGNGVHDSSDDLIPRSLAVHEELFRGLQRLSKPVEMYYYPNEEHQLDHPKARLASLDRNLDWYRFWLQGYERPSPADPDQYKRWEHLRELRDADAKAIRGSDSNR
jgi:dipeptidyl aminopeptidase/acylaminoacyl peptidase